MNAFLDGTSEPATDGEARSRVVLRTGAGLRLRMLYVGNLGLGQTSQQRLQALEHLGCEVTGVHTAQPNLPRVRHLVERVRRRLRGPRDWTGANRQIREWAARAPFDVLWIDKGLTITAETLRSVKARQPDCQILGFSPDDMYQRHNQSPQFRKHLPLYDLFFTTKTFGVAELRSIGCMRVAFHHNGFDPDTHRPLTLSAADRARYGGPVGFVGTWEAARAASIRQLAAAGIPVRVWGMRWASQFQPQPNLRIEPTELLGLDYARALNGFDINLCFLRKLNRDRQTTRSIEIPACGAFMLAERTDEHLVLFKEGVEAEFFGSDEEMLDKTRYYLAHPDARQRIAKAGLERCRTGRYSYHERLLDMLTTAGLVDGGAMLECG
jgi:spore maturation protein CgeB